jgi:hypothetical protein
MHLSRALLAGFSALLLGSCGGSAGSTPSAPVVPTATPSLAPTPEAISRSCERLPLGTPNHTCRSEGAVFYPDVVDAIARLQQERPELFQGENVTNIGAYLAGLVRILDGKGLCAAYDGEELAVKNSAEFSEQYRVLASWGQIRRAYMVTCTPAVFPLSRHSPEPSPSGCPLAPSSQVACGRASATLLADLEAAIDVVVEKRSELFDPSQKAPGGDGPRLTDPLAYHLAVVQALTARGVCAKFDGEEIQAKRSNEFSEHFDINVADTYLRRGAGTYRSSCYPAAF